jgi:tripartite-type tricarboxylate transporter receptor subunit TctC
MLNKGRNISAVLCAVSALFLAGSAVAQDAYPSKPITVIVPFPAGGALDVMVRHIGNAFAQRNSQRFVVENKAGGATQIAANACKGAKPDGYTVCLLTYGTMSVNPTFYRGKLAYDPYADFEPVTNVAFAEHMIVLNRQIPAKNFAEFIAYAKANPGKLNYGSYGVANDAHLIFEWIKRLYNISMVHVPFAGTAPAMLAFKRNDVSLLYLTPGNGPLLAEVKEGKTVALAVEGEKRLSILPNTPSFKEVGLPQSPLRSWFAFYVPKGTPKEAINVLHQKVAEILKDPAYQEKYLTPNGLTADGSGPAELTKLMKETEKSGAELLDMAGVKPGN